jgi:hypothetical protein
VVFFAVVFFAVVFFPAEAFLAGAFEEVFAVVDFLAADVDFVAALDERRPTPAVTRLAAAAVLPAIFFAVVRAMTRGPLKMPGNVASAT